MSKIEINSLENILNDEDIKTIVNGYAYIVLTDWIGITEMKDMEKYIDTSKFLELRIFNTNKEVRIKRSSLEADIYKRTIQNDEEKDYFDEEYYLDIDTAKSNKEEVFSTGGGKVRIPEFNLTDLKIIVRKYIGYYKSTGQAYIKDWRLLGFKEA